MYILAFETSCDDTSIAIFEDSRLITMDTKSQIREHLGTCWVVPEVAARLHSNNIFLVLEKVLNDSWINLNQIDYIACTEEPGLLPSLYVGLTVAKTLSGLLNKPLIFINHIQAHIFANLLERWLEELIFPSVCLTVSGWHNELYYWKSLFELELIWETQDDSAWEAFDKVAKMMWLGFPGWPIISKLASEYSWVFKWIFPKVILSKDSLDFSFSWLKSAVKREVDIRIQNAKLNNNWEFFLAREEENFLEKEKTKFEKDKEIIDKFLSVENKKEIAFEFENTVTEILSDKLLLAAARYNVNSIVLAWWVSANTKLKSVILEKAKEKWLNFIYPTKPVFSQDNAAMVWILAYYRILFNNF